MVFIWKVTFSSHACRASHWRAISPILCWIAWMLDEELAEGAPGRANAMDSSTQVRALRALPCEEPPLVVEVVHHLFETLADLTHDVGLGHRTLSNSM